MEEDKAAAYYEELTRKGEGAARFKQGLGFSSAQSSEAITKGSALSSSSSFLSSFVRASGPSNEPDEIDKQAQLEKIQNKLKKKSSSERDKLSRAGDRDAPSTTSRSRDRYDSKSSRRDRDRDRDRERDREGERYRDRGRSERRRGRSRSRSRSCSDEERRHRRSSRERHGRGRRRSRSTSPRDRRVEKSRNEGKSKKERNVGAVDYSQLIKGYADMTPAEKVKAKMKLQLSQTAEKDADKGMGAGWERFDFDKDAPLDDEEIEEADDDALVVKKMGQSFRFSAIEARREDEIRAAHDQAMFGAPVAQPSIPSDEEPTIADDRTSNRDVGQETPSGSDLNTNLLSDKVLAKQQGSWRDRARRVKDG